MALAQNIKGITIEISGKTTKLEQALKKAETAARDAGKELRQIDRLIKYNPKNTELLAQKHRALGQQISETKKKLDALKKAEAEASKLELGDEEVAAFRREIIETESKLQNLTKKMYELDHIKLTNIGKQMQDVGEKMKTAGEHISDVGGSLTKKLTLPLAGAGTLMTKSAIDFESAFAGVKKTVDATDEQFAALEKGIRDMSKQLPSSASEIAGVAEAAGQLGIETDNILSFSKTMIDLGESTNLGSEEAATQLARFANITRMSQKDFDKLGSSIVDLGNNFATTEAEIVSLGLRLAGTGALVGLTETDIMGLATAMSSVGISAEAGGSAMSKVMQKINTAVADGAEASADFAAVAGMSADNFAKAWKEKPIDALTEFVRGLGNVKDEGGNVTGVLEELGIKGLRETDVLQRLAGNADLLSDAVKTSGNAWEENAALTNEANQRYATLESKLQMAKNTLNDVAVTIGEKLMPFVEKAIVKIQEFAEWFSTLDDKTIETGIKIAAFVAAAGPLLMVIGKVVSVGGTLVGGIGKLITNMTALGAKLAATGSSLSAIVGTIAGVAAIVGVLAAAFMTLWKNNDKFRENITNTWNNIKETFENLTSGITERLNALGFNFEGFGEVVSAIWNGFTELLAPVFEGAFKNIANVFDLFVTTFFNIWDTFSALFRGDWEGVWDGIKSIFTGIWDGLKNYFDNILTTIKNIADVVLGWFGTSFDEIFGKIKTTVTNAMDKVKNTVSDAWNGVKDRTDKIWNGIKDTITNVVTGIRDSVRDKFNAVKDTAKSIFESVENLITAPVKRAKDFIGNQIEKIKGFFDFNWSLPKLKLPHFSITGKFSLAPPQVPKLGIDWYDKGGIFTGPQIIGVGEKRPEFVGALDDLKAIVKTALSEHGGGSGVTIQVENMNVRDDSDIEKIARELYRLQRQQERGVGIA